MTEVTPHPLKTQGFHHFFILLFYDHPANDVTIMKEGHPEAGTPLFWWVRLELNQRCFRCHGFTDRCDRQLRALTHMAESAELESDTMRCDPLSGRSPDLLGSLSKYGCGGWIRTNKCRCQRPVP